MQKRGVPKNFVKNFVFAGENNKKDGAGKARSRPGQRKEAITPGRQAAVLQQDKDGKTSSRPMTIPGGKSQFAQRREQGKVTHGANRLQAGADVADAGHHGGKGGAEREVVQGHHQAGGENDEHIGAQEDGDGVQDLFLHHTSVQLDHVDRAGVDDLADLPADIFEQQQHPGAFDPRRRWTRRRRRRT